LLSQLLVGLIDLVNPNFGMDVLRTIGSLDPDTTWRD
jgi:hypothetical protein